MRPSREAHPSRGRDDGEVADLAFELLVGGALAGPARRTSMRGEDLVLGQRGPVEVEEEVCGTYPPRPARPDQLEGGVTRQHGGGLVVAGVGVGHVAPDGGAVAHERVGDDAARLGQERAVLAHEGRGLQLRLAHHGAQDEAVARARDAPQLPDAAEVHEVGGLGEAELHEREQALAPGEHLGLRAELFQQGDGRAELEGRVVVERCRVHADLVTSCRPDRVGPGGRSRPRSGPP